MTSDWEVAVVGGSAAGLSAALTLGRARRRVVVVDAGRPRNRVAPHLHGLLGHDGRPPAELLAAGRAEIESYGGVLLSGMVASVRRTENRFLLSLRGGSVLGAGRLVVTTGLTDELPALDGLAAHWGRGAVACPYCHGWEARDRRIGVLATGPASPHQALLLRQWSPQVSYLTGGGPPPDADTMTRLLARDIRVEYGSLQAVTTDGTGTLDGVRFTDGRRHGLDALFLAPRIVPRDDLLLALGARREPGAPGVGGRWVVVDATGRTTVPGVWAAGNVVNPQANLPIAAAAGAWAGAAVNADLVEEETQHAVAAWPGRA